MNWVCLFYFVLFYFMDLFYFIYLEEARFGELVKAWIGEERLYFDGMELVLYDSQLGERLQRLMRAGSWGLRLAPPSVVAALDYDGILVALGQWE